jgi:predicted RNase H-like HicB family nuclease
MKDLRCYLRLEYPLRVEPDPEGGFVASIPDLPGCYSAGETKQEAVAHLEESRVAWIESYYAIHGEAPEPAGPSSFSGRILLRMPKYLHRKLHDAARDEGISINQYAISLLAEGIAGAKQLKHGEQKARGLMIRESSAQISRRARQPKRNRAGKV